MSDDVGPSGFGFSSTAEQVTEGLSLEGTTWLVTGCNSGLGLETTRVLALRGGHVLGAARTVDKAKAAFVQLGLTSDQATPIACELSDLDSARQAAASVVATGRRLNGIIANAGIMALPALRQKNGYELQFYTNHVGHFVLVTGLIDQLTDDGRVVMLSSGAHFMAGDEGIEFDNLSGERDYDPWRMYGQSKLANILFAQSLAKRFADAGSARVANAVHPGVIRTNLARHIEDAEAMFDNLKSRVTFKSVPQGAATQVLVATHPSLATTNGAYFADCNVAPTKDYPYDALAPKLWQVTEGIVSA